MIEAARLAGAASERESIVSFLRGLTINDFETETREQRQGAQVAVDAAKFFAHTIEGGDHHKRPSSSDMKGAAERLLAAGFITIGDDGRTNLTEAGREDLRSQLAEMGIDMDEAFENPDEAIRAMGFADPLKGKPIKEEGHD